MAQSANWYPQSIAATLEVMTARWSDPHRLPVPTGSEKAAAHRLGLSHSTVKHHLANARSKVGALEDLLSHWGERVIDRLETDARDDPKLMAACDGVWKLFMPDEVWTRLRSLVNSPRQT